MTELIIGPTGASHVRLSDPTSEGDDLWSFRIQMLGPGLAADGGTQTLGGHLIEFLQRLAEMWSGWEGVQAWIGIDENLRIEASRDRAGHVFLRIAMDESLLPPRWTAEVTIRLDAGEDMKRLARDVEHFLTSRS